MQELQQKLQTELDRARALCSTNNSYYSAYSYGVEFALNEVKKMNTPPVETNMPPVVVNQSEEKEMNWWRDLPYFKIFELIELHQMKIPIKQEEIIKVYKIEVGE